MVRKSKANTTAVKSYPIGEISLDPSNVRTHSTKNIDAIKASLKRFGQQKPIVVDRDLIVRAGNGTLEAASALGWETINAVVSGLSPSELVAYAIADNRTAELAEWDDEALKKQLDSFDEELKSIAFDGFDMTTTEVTGSKELDESSFDNFDNQCPKCGFEWDKK